MTRNSATKAISNLQDVWTHSLREVRRQMIGAKLYRIIVAIIFIFALYECLTTIRIGQGTNTDKKSNVDPKYLNRRIKQIEELESIKQSVSNELRELEDKRNRIQDDITLHQGTLTSLQRNVKDLQSELKSLKRQILMAKSRRVEVEKPQLPAPARLLPGDDDNVDISPPSNFEKCQMYSCFDYSRCSLTSQFPIFVYSMDSSFPFDLSSYVTQVLERMTSNPYVIDDPKAACLYVAVVGETMFPANDEDVSIKIENWLAGLPFWRGDGRNHLLIYFSKLSTISNYLSNVNTGRAMIAQSNFSPSQYRMNFDVIIPTLSALKTSSSTDYYDENGSDETESFSDENMGQDWDYMDVPYQLPAVRQYILSFQGEWTNTDGDLHSYTDDFHKVLMTNMNFLKKMDGDRYFIETSCKDGRVLYGFNSEWSVCGTFALRSKVLSKSTFSLVFPAEDYKKVASSSIFNTRLAESLRLGAVPVIVGTYVNLPFQEFIDWNKAALIIPQSRFTELPHLLANIPHAEILAFRKQGWFLYNTYFASSITIFESILAVVRTRLQIPPLSVSDVQGNVVKHRNYKVENHSVSPGDAQSEFGIPPAEERTDSLTFSRNFTCVTSKVTSFWNAAPGPFHLYPHTPSDEQLPTDAQFVGSSSGFQNIGGGEGGTGKVYQESLGGNCASEQFTVVMLTYEREDVLLQAIERLMGLPHLNKVVVVWNSNGAKPSIDLQWPDIGVEVVVIQTDKNSLNNRFIPYSDITTEAVLSIDDDAHLRHDEILFGFRVWRESRDRIVGFPGRFHAWNAKDGQWNYNSNHTCELSMVLTGAAFFHKYYMYMYTNWMPAYIRDLVDEFMNCEDIAMNFLVSHLTKKPPIKVTSRWTFKCPGCPVALSQSQEHFDERHTCINRFMKVFGYMPLLFTQFRVDSVLFKTRLPHDKQKCFKFI